MASTNLVPGSGRGSAFDAFLARTTCYEAAGAPVPRRLLAFGLCGSLVVIATGVLALVFPGPQSIRHGQFFLILGTPAASLESVMRALALPAIGCGVALLLLDLYLMQGRRSEQWRAAVVGQFAIGGAGGILGAAFVALVILNVVLWLVLTAIAGAMVLIVLSGMAGGD